MIKQNKNKRTKIFAVGDIHGDCKLAKKLAEKAKKQNPELIILTGDLTTVEQPIENLLGYFAKLKKPILLIPGNHERNETINFLAEKYSARNLHGNYYIKNNIGIFGAGGAEIGPFPTSEEEIAKSLKKAHEKIKHIDKKIMITHAHATETIMDELCIIPASKAVRKAIEEFQPDILIHGHSHESAGLEDKIGKTRIINVARKEIVIEV